MKIRLKLTTVIAMSAIVLLTGCGGNKPHELERGGLSAGDLMQSLLDQTMVTLGGVTSRATAEEALPMLEEINDQFKELSKTKGELSDQGQADLAAQAQKAMPGLKDNWRRVNMQSYADILRPVMEDMIGNLTNML
jgi:hypothetical protein